MLCQFCDIRVLAQSRRRQIFRAEGKDRIRNRVPVYEGRDGYAGPWQCHDAEEIGGRILAEPRKPASNVPEPSPAGMAIDPMVR